MDDASNNIGSSEDFSELWSDIDDEDDEAVVDPEGESYAELIDSLEEDDSLSLSGFDESDRLLSVAQTSIHGQTTMEVSRVPSGLGGLVVAATAGVTQQTLSPTGGHLAAQGIFIPFSALQIAANNINPQNGLSVTMIPSPFTSQSCTTLFHTHVTNVTTRLKIH